MVVSSSLGRYGILVRSCILTRSSPIAGGAGWYPAGLHLVACACAVLLLNPLLCSLLCFYFALYFASTLLSTLLLLCSLPCSLPCSLLCSLLCFYFALYLPLPYPEPYFFERMKLVLKLVFERMKLVSESSILGASWSSIVVVTP